MVLSVVSYIVIPLYTLLFVRGTAWFSSNFSVISSLKEKENAFALWGALVSCTLYRMLFPLIQSAPFSKNSYARLCRPPFRRFCYLLLNLAFLFLIAAVIVPYLPGQFPIQAGLHIFFAFFSAVFLFLCLIVLIYTFYTSRPARYAPYFFSVWASAAVSILLLKIAGIVSTVLEVFVTIAACVLVRKLYREVFGQ